MRKSDPGWKAQRAKGTELLQAEVLRKIPWLLHGFSTRIGGKSRLAGKPALNLGFTEWDNRAAVTANRATLLAALGAAKMPLASLRQVHSDVLHVLAAPQGACSFELPAAGEIPAGDAAATRNAGVMLSVQTADCVPILLVDTKHRVVVAIHAGWRGTLARIATKTLGRLQQEFGTRAEDVVAAIGPAIGRCCYEVGPDIARAFASQFSTAADWFDGPFVPQSEGEGQHWLPWLTMMPPGHQPEPERAKLDLRAANRWQLVDAGVSPKKIVVSTLCTRCRADLFFSYRREGAGTGRMMAVIGIREQTPRRAAARPPARSKRAGKSAKRAIR